MILEDWTSFTIAVIFYFWAVYFLCKIRIESKNGEIENKNGVIEILEARIKLRDDQISELERQRDKTGAQIKQFRLEMGLEEDPLCRQHH